MKATQVNVSEAQIGKTVAEDVFANTQYPIVYKNTVITNEHLQVFDAFQIRRISVVGGQSTQDEISEYDTLIDSIIQNVSYDELNTFKKIYEDTINTFQKEFSAWESGVKPEFAKVRFLILPLVERALEERSVIFDLNDFSNPKDYLYHHCIATSLIVAVLSQKLGFDRGLCIQMAIGGLLADSGMAKISPKIREKKSALTRAEFLEIKKHPIYSYQLVQGMQILKSEIKQAIFQHHERLDGSGYPKGDKIEKISTYSQIIAVADVFHAMTSERIYRSKESPFKVIEMIKESEFGKFDIKVVQALIDLVTDLPIGTRVELSNLERGEVMFVNQFSPTRPLIKLEGTGEIIDLDKKRSYHISRIIN